jgi:prephenate dehydrogenase
MPGRYDLDVTTLGQLLNDPEARAIIVEVVPELPGHPMIGMVKNMPANAVLAMAAGQLPADTAAALKERITAL